MGRGDWMRQNLKGLQRLIEPLAARVLERRSSATDRPAFARKALGTQIGGLLGYVSRRVLGQFDVFLPPDDDGLIYFVGPNLIDVERSFGLSPRDFRLWVSIHEVTHRVQFSVAPWLRGEITGMVDSYLETVSLDTKEMLEQLARAAEELRPGQPGGLLRLLTPEQRPLFERTQAMMSLLEGHASFVMNRVADDVVDDLASSAWCPGEAPSGGGVGRNASSARSGSTRRSPSTTRGERFVEHVVERVGMSGFNLVWEGPGNLPRARRDRRSRSLDRPRRGVTPWPRGGRLP